MCNVFNHWLPVSLVRGSNKQLKTEHGICQFNHVTLVEITRTWRLIYLSAYMALSWLDLIWSSIKHEFRLFKAGFLHSQSPVALLVKTERWPQVYTVLSYFGKLFWLVQSWALRGSSTALCLTDLDERKTEGIVWLLQPCEMLFFITSVLTVLDFAWSLSVCSKLGPVKSNKCMISFYSKREIVFLIHLLLYWHQFSES